MNLKEAKQKKGQNSVETIFALVSNNRVKPNCLFLDLANSENSPKLTLFGLL